MLSPELAQTRGPGQGQFCPLEDMQQCRRLFLIPTAKEERQHLVGRGWGWGGLMSYSVQDSPHHKESSSPECHGPRWTGSTPRAGASVGSLHTAWTCGTMLGLGPAYGMVLGRHCPPSPSPSDSCPGFAWPVSAVCTPWWVPGLGSL